MNKVYQLEITTFAKGKFVTASSQAVYTDSAKASKALKAWEDGIRNQGVTVMESHVRTLELL